MKNKERAEEIKREIDRLKNELKAVQGSSQLSIKNNQLLTYPFVAGNARGFNMQIEQRYLNLASIALDIRLVMTPEYRLRNEKATSKGIYPKHIKDLSEDEFKAVCDCLDEVVEVIDRHRNQLHPEGIAYGRYVDGMELYKPARRLEIVPETKEVG